MKKYTALLLTALLLCTGCQAKNVEVLPEIVERENSRETGFETINYSTPENNSSSSDSSWTGDSWVDSSSYAESSSYPVEPEPQPFFKPGVWQCSEYYFYEFEENGTSGRIVDLNSSIEMPFEYEIIDSGSGTVMFHVYSADDESPAKARMISDSEISLEWDFGRTDNITYLPGITLDDVELATGQFFIPGTWRGANSYYFFNEDGSSGSTQSFENGTGVGFRYEVMSRENGFVNLHMGSSDNNSGVVISDMTEDSFTMIWEDGTAENFVYVSPLGANEFVFYTNEQIMDIAQRYYTGTTNYTTQYCRADSLNDGTVRIQLYDLGTHTTITSAWYTIDRVTLKGTDDMSQTEVDMSAYAN